jgi:hypothetical protein
MKKIILIILFSLISFSAAEAYILEARAIADLVSTIKSTKFAYKERGMIFGYNTIQSCLYVSKEIAILKNYCYPSKKYPAKSFTVISPKFGIIDFYQEEFAGNSDIKHDLRISTFPDILKDYFTENLETETISSINLNMEKLYQASYPACWTTNYRYEDGKPDFGCLDGSLETVINLQKWYNETQSLTANKKSWNELLKIIDASLL